MTDLDPQSRPGDLRAVHERLCAARPEASALELDRIKLRAITRTPRYHSRPSRGVYTRRLVSVALTIGLLGGSTVGFAASGGFKGASGHGSAAQSQYKPGKGCGDQNHVHPRRSECN
jgi:hypothetical protein